MRALALAVVAVVASGCWHIEGSGVLKEETRQVGEFSEIEISGALTAEVSVGTEAQVVVSGDDNIVAIVETSVSGRTLTISPEDGVTFSEKQPLVVHVIAPSIEGIEASGASTVNASGLGGSALSIEASGASSIVASGISGPSISIVASGASIICASGWADEATVDASGASKVQGKDLGSNVARVDASGASLVDIGADCEVDANASGASEIRVHGSARINEETSGGSKVTRAD